MFVYLAGPVDAVDADVARGWRDIATEQLIQTRPNIATFSPPHAIRAGAAVPTAQDTSLAIMEVNRTALRHADFVIANLNGPSFGTPIECYEANCPVIGFGELARMQKSIYQHLFAALTVDLEEAIRVTLRLFKEAEKAVES